MMSEPRPVGDVTPLDGDTFGPSSGDKIGEFDGDDSSVTLCGKASG